MIVLLRLLLLLTLTTSAGISHIEYFLLIICIVVIDQHELFDEDSTVCNDLSMINNDVKHFVDAFSCTKCRQPFEHEETVALFKQHQYHFHCFLCAHCQRTLSHESFYLDEQLQLNVSMHFSLYSSLIMCFLFLSRFPIHKFIVNHVTWHVYHRATNVNNCLLQHRL
jgi:hypothetical protein